MQRQVEAKIQFSLLEPEDLQAFWQLVQQGQTLCYRDCAGNCLFGCVTKLESEQNAQGAQFALTLCQVEHTLQIEDEVSAA